jgi:peptidyl-prolyl cis-trans isomerase B (cyclophilin B)
MRAFFWVFVAILAITVQVPSQVWAQEAKVPTVILVTTMGEIVIELEPDKATASVENFLKYVDEGFYDGTIFHRVINQFMIQGGGFTEDMTKKTTRGGVPNEADNGLSNARGTVAMARTGDPHSATAQFFINTADNKALDHKGKTAQEWGYTVFGKVVEGMDVVDDIENVKTSSKGSFRDVPSEPVIIIEAKRRGKV